MDILELVPPSLRKSVLKLWSTPVVSFVLTALSFVRPAQQVEWCETAHKGCVEGAVAA
jgi:hypothetical protein